MTVIHAARPKFLRKQVLGRDWIGWLKGQQVAATIVPRIPKIRGKAGFDLPDRAILTSESSI
jgi:hypothetical protein